MYCNGNNGDLTTATLGTPTPAVDQNFTYDGVDRLKTANETGGSWSLTYNYDQWGNHWLYWVAPMLGGAAAARAYKSIVMMPKPKS